MEEKKKRAKCATSTRTTIILNSLNPREKVILDFLSTQFNKSDSIKDILYDYIITNNLQADMQPIISNLSVNSNQVISNLSNDDKYVVSNDTTNDNTMISNGEVNDNIMINDCVQDDNKQPSKDITSNNNFSIDLSAIEDEEMSIKSAGSEEKEDATANAMDFLLKM